MNAEQASSQPFLTTAILSVHYLRAAAALAVVTFHLSGKLPLNGVQAAYYSIGAAGVDVFFAISGFVMCYTTAGRDTDILTFYRKRIVRVAPLYYFVTTLVIAIIILAPALVNIGTLETTHIVLSYLFVAWHHPGWPTRLWPVVVPGWTLNYEMYFYFLFGLTLLVPKSIRPTLMVVGFSSLVAIGTIGGFNGVGGFYTSPLLLEFVGGYLFGLLFLRGWTISRPAGLAIVGLSLCSLALFGPLVHSGDWERVTFWGVPALGILVGLVMLDRHSPLRPRRLPYLLGDASYAIYLLQFICVPAFAVAWKQIGLPLDGLMHLTFLVLGLVVVSLSGIAVHLGIERPLTGALNARRASPTLAG